MADLPRLNGVIGALEKGQIAFTSFCPPVPSETMAFAGTDFDGIVIEMEHNPWDSMNLRDCLQYMLNRAQIVNRGTLAPKVTPLCRVPVNGVEVAQWQAKQALDAGCYGIVFPHISSVEQAYNAVAAARYPRLADKDRFEPQGIRGDGPTAACRYWGLSQQDYYAKADVWPYDPNGEILCILQIEDTAGIKALPDMLKNVPGIGVILIGEGDLGQELGYPRQYDHPALLEAMAEVVAICKEHDVVVGHPHANAGNMEALIEQGYGFLMTGVSKSYPGLAKGRELTGRA